MNNEPIRIGLDFHGVVDKYPEYFSCFTHLAKQKGIEVYIITGGPRKVVDRFLQDHKIIYKELFAILDYYDAQGMVEYYKNGEYKVPDMLWNMAKGEYCAEKKITIHIDDSKEYADWFSTPFCFYDAQNRKCTLGNKISIDFTGDPEQTLEQIYKTFHQEQLIRGE